MSRSPRADKPSAPAASGSRPAPRRRAPKAPRGPAPVAVKGAPERVASPRHIHLGDTLKVERRYVVDGSLTSVMDQGRFKGVQLLGSTEHLLLEDGAAEGVRMIPIHTISEILIVGADAPRGARDAFDPSFA